jgi:hypothetical protein
MTTDSIISNVRRLPMVQQISQMDADKEGRKRQIFISSAVRFHQAL